MQVVYGKKNSSAHGHNLEIHCKETMPELTETCPNQDVINDKKLTDVCHFGQNIVNSDISVNFLSLWTIFYQLFFVIYHVLIRTYFLSIRALFPCSDYRRLLVSLDEIWRWILIAIQLLDERSVMTI